MVNILRKGTKEFPENDTSISYVEDEVGFRFKRCLRKKKPFPLGDGRSHKAPNTMMPVTIGILPVGFRPSGTRIFFDYMCRNIICSGKSKYRTA